MVADTIAKLRIDNARKLRWQTSASARGRTLSTFMRLACDSAAEGMDAASIRADLVRVRRLVNAVSDLALSVDKEKARRLTAEAAEVRRIIDRHLAIGSRT